MRPCAIFQLAADRGAFARFLGFPVVNRPAAASTAGAVTVERQAREVIACGLVAAVAASVAVLVLPRGGDLAAHLYRTGLVRHGILVWDNLWFAGQYPLASYSLLYYPLAALVGNAVLGVAGAVAAAAIFASVATREWRSAGRWPARAFAVLLAGQAFTAAYPYDLGLATLLGTLWALQRRRARLAALCTLLTLGFSPLAFLFLALALLALFLHRRRLNRNVLAVGAAVAGAAAVQLAFLVELPSPGLVYPYGAWRLLAGLAVAGLGVALSLRGRGGAALASLFGVWAAASVVVYLVPSPIGHNLVRASVFVFPLMLVAGALADFRPRWLGITAAAAALAANVAPYAPMIADRTSTAGSKVSFWRPIIGFLDRHRVEAGFRVEVVPTANHWEAYYLPRAGFALARGWYRQLDIADNPALYARRLTPPLYRAWLRSRAVRYVVLADLPLEAIDGEREAALLRSAGSGLREVWHDRRGSVYELPDPTPILTGPGSTTVTAIGSSTISGRVGRPGVYLLRVHFTPYWSVLRGSLCLAPSRTAMTLLEMRMAGRFTIAAIESPGRLLTAIFDHDRSRCRR
jgi:hypothetical protein